MSNVFTKAAAIFSPAPSAAPEDAPRPLPAGILESDGHAIHASPDLIALTVDGWIIKQKIDALQKQLKEITGKLENSLGAGASIAVDGVCKVTISERTSFSLTDPDQAQKILAGRFEDLVSQETSYTLTDKLKEMVLDADHPLAAGLRDCIAIKSGVSVTFRAGKAL